ncbi:DUF6443 domain-containing protein [Chryseobacterium pennipullorum]|uniref:RHS repeat-associated core domain-containing protein n=1 Tax=Chryseobacterium pennipullorum TaxID=2258963 RepID=A0A3D9AKB4_9FLAO|nr:DUF6443 domain-containing protein [Chryseobacterium pennipullorum]REC41605.1 RHS repeat-associated core domain-containing protein [Chryseobacterium pennipullorum]
MKKYLLSLILFLSFTILLKAQNLTQAENYLYSRVYLEAVTTSSSTAKQIQEVSYFDGLGRPKQNISIKETPTGKDLLIPIEYDAFGRQTKNILPLPQQGTGNGGIFTSPDMAGAASVYGNASNYYSEKKIENSPLNRVLENAAPGDPWKMANGKTIKYTFQTNSDSEVRKFIITTSWSTVSGVSVGTPTLKISTENNPYASGGSYKAGTLYKNTVNDEDGNTTVTFSNSKGQILLVRKNDGSQNVDTYYAYNEYGQQVFVILPLAVKAIAAANNSITTATLNDLCYQYRYDNQNRMVEKKFPGKDWEYIVYDQQNRIALIQDGNLRTTTNNFNARGWMFTKYDALGRAVYTGFFANTATRQAIQNTLNSMSSNAANNEKFSSTGITQNGMNIYYSIDAFPKENITILSVNYYDTYPSDAPAKPDMVLGQNTLNPVPSNTTVNSITTSRTVKGLPTASYVRNINDTNWTKDYVWYDLKGREIGTYSMNHLGGFTKTETELDFTGVPRQMITFHKRRNTEAGLTIKERFEYDGQNRLLKHWHKVDSRPEELLAENTYNELSQLISKKVGNGLQTIDYAYNIRGWLTGINEKQMSLPNLGGKLFSYKVKYNQKDGITNPDPAFFSGKDVVPKFNGNIAEVDWRAVETVGVNPASTPKRYGYAYDKFNRLLAGYYQNPNNPYSKENTESLTYDLDSKISNLYRTSVIENNNTTATVIDNLNYVYTGNKISAVNDITGNTTGYEGGGNSITYDMNGNMVNLLDKKITSIKYNFLNLPDKIVMSTLFGDYLGYTYTADGTKLQKISPSLECGIIDCNTISTITDYLDGFQYLSKTSSGGGGDSESMALTKEMSRAMETQAFSPDANRVPPPPSKTPNLQFFSTSEGYYDYEKDQYIYQYKDLLGNVRVSFGRSSAGALEIVDANDYYPFGMNHLKTGNSIFAQSSFKNYKFLGNELQETGLYDMGARFYIPELGIFGQHDPLSASTLDPYGYAYNNPLFYADPTGLYGDPVNGGKNDIPANSLGGSNNPYQIEEIVLDAPVRAMASKLPNCSYCHTGGGVKGELQSLGIIPPPISSEETWRRLHTPILHNGSAYMMSGDMLGISDLLGIVFSKLEPENEEAALGLSALAIILTKGKATPGIIKGEIAVEKGAILGNSISNNYKSTFFTANPELKGTVVVHHAVEQQALKRYPGLITESEMHSLENLRGIPKSINSDVHLSQIRKIWNKFYKENANPTKKQILDQATIIDQKFGRQFTPQVK